MPRVRVRQLVGSPPDELDLWLIRHRRRGNRERADRNRDGEEPDASTVVPGTGLVAEDVGAGAFAVRTDHALGGGSSYQRARVQAVARVREK